MAGHWYGECVTNYERCFQILIFSFSSGGYSFEPLEDKEPFQKGKWRVHIVILSEDTGGLPCVGFGNGYLLWYYETWHWSLHQILLRDFNIQYIPKEHIIWLSFSSNRSNWPWNNPRDWFAAANKYLKRLSNTWMQWEKAKYISYIHIEYIYIYIKHR